MDYSNTIITRILNDEEYKLELNIVIDILRQNHIDKIDLLFGVAWGNEYKDWTPFTIGVDEIINEVDKAQKLNVGQLRNDDLYIILTEMELEFLFCHESDIHISFNYANDIVTSIINKWDTKQLSHSTKTRNGG